jgi:hypothetical protein
MGGGRNRGKKEGRLRESILLIYPPLNVPLNVPLTYTPITLLLKIPPQSLHNTTTTTTTTLSYIILFIILF